jgi:DNA-binding beta-propeller fold protein YncE
MGTETNVIVSDSDNNRIRKITPQGQVSTLAGTGQQGHLVDREGTVAQFNGPRGVAVDGDENVIVADSDNNRIRMITPHGQVSTLAGTGEEGHEEGDGGASSAQLSRPMSDVLDENGNVIVADTHIRRVASDVVTPPYMFLSVLPLRQSSFVSDIERLHFESGSFHDLVCFVVGQERVHGHRSHLSFRRRR